MSKFWILVGSFTPLVSVLEFNTSPPSLVFHSQSRIGASPSWITRSSNYSNPSILYATEDVQRGFVHSFTFNHETASMSLVDSVSTGGSYTPHLALIRGGTEVVAANYGGSNVGFASVTGGTDLGSSPSVTAFQGRGPEPNQEASHPHQAVEFGTEVLIPDLGADKIWRLTKQNGAWVNSGSISTPSGSGPRHLVTVGNNIYTLHENANTVTQHLVTPLSEGIVEPKFIAEASIRPVDTSASVNLDAAEILYAESPTPLLYASNRKDTSSAGDAIAILTPSPLKTIAFFRTGLKEIRAMEFIGPNKEYLIVGGLQGGGIKLYRRVPAEQGYLSLLAQLQDKRIVNPSAFVPIVREENGGNNCT